MLGQEISLTHLHVQFGSDLLSSVAMTTPMSVKDRCSARCAQVEKDLDDAPSEGYMYVKRFLPEKEGGQSENWHVYTSKGFGFYRRVLNCGGDQVLKINLARKKAHFKVNANEQEFTHVSKSSHLVIGYAIEARIGYT